MTPGAFGALGVTIRALCDAGDEVIFLSPPWFFYELMIASSGATAVRVRLAAPEFDLDPDAVAAAITPRTRAIIVNSPNNPSGRIYREPELAALAGVLTTPRRATAVRSCCISDESYNRIVFDGIDFHSPALDYDATMTIYTYGKTLLAPGQRIGYAAMTRTFPDREAMSQRLVVQQLAAGWGFPNALLQHAIGDLESLSVDIGALQARRDRMVPALRVDGLRGDSAGRHVLPHGALARPRRHGLHRAPGAARRDRPARHDRRVSGLVPHLADRQRRDGGTRPRGLRGSRRAIGGGTARRPPARLRRPSLR